jgi:quinol monooxygenase YgiN
MNRNSAKKSSRRAAYYGVFMALIVFGGMIYYLLDTRPRSYRAEGGDLWVFEYFQPTPEQKQPLIDALSVKAKSFDAPGFWGVEILASDDSEVTLLTRWQNQTAYQTFLQSPAAKIFSPSPELPPQNSRIQLQEVKMRR